MNDVWYKELFFFNTLASMSNSQLISTHKAHEMAWGYIDPMLEVIHRRIDNKVDPWWGLNRNQTSIEQADQETNFDTFKTGKGSLNEIQEYVQWQGNSSLSIWATPAANKVRGTDATQFHPDIKQKDNLVVFVSDAFR